MDPQTRTQTYPGLFRSQAEEAFRRDAADAAAHGWYPTGQRWDGQALVVTYAYGAPATPPGAWSNPIGTQPAEAPPGARSVDPAAVVLIGAAVAIAVGSFLPWATATNGFVSVSQTGVGGGDGWVSLILAGVLALCGWSTLWGSKGRTWLTAFAASLLLIGLALYEIGDITKRSIDNILDYGIPFQTGIGILLILAAGVVAALAGFGVRPKKAAVIPAAITPVPQPAPAFGAQARPSPAQEAVQRSGGSSPLLIAGVGLLAVVIGGVAGMAMIGAGPFETRRTVALEDITPYVTPAPKPVAGSWSKVDVIATLGSIGFVGDTEPGDTWEGGFEDHSVIVHSAGNAVTGMELILSIPAGDDDAAHEAGVVIGTLLSYYAPDAGDFVTDQIDRVVDGKKGQSRTFGDAKVSTLGSVTTDGFLFVLGLEPA
jgi:hypothetical protein